MIDGVPGEGLWTNIFYDSSNLGANAFVSNTGGKYQTQSLSSWEALGYDAGAQSGNPQFQDPSTNNYTIPGSSPAHAMGIYNLPVSQMGLGGFQKANSYDLYGT
jgi:hypothetical protein